MTRVLALGLALALCAGCSGGGSEPTASGCDPHAPGTICTIAGNGKNGYDGDEPIRALDAKMSLPQDLVVGPDGVLYILDWNNHRIRSLGSDGILRHVAGRGELGGSLDDPANSDFNHPTGLLFGPDPNLLYIVAWHNSKIRSVDLTTLDIEDDCGDGRRGYFGDETPALTATLDLPTSMLIAPNGDFVIMDQANQVIRRVDGDGIIHRMAGICMTDQDAPCAEGEEPVQCPNGSGKFTCGDPLRECLKPCNPSYAPGGDDPLSLRMAQPFGQAADPGGRLAYDADGNLYFADTANHLIRRITTDGHVELVAGIEPVDGKAVSGTAPDGTPATETPLYRPTDLAFGDDGTLYFTDVYNHCVREVATDGNVYTVAGQCGQKGFSGDGGAPTDALLNLPYGIELDGSTLYVADTGNNRIRVVNLP